MKTVKHTCVSSLVGVAFLVFKIKFPFSVFLKFPFRPSPWSSKNLLDQNWLKKFMQVGIDVTCMYTKFGGRGLSGFGDKATLKNGQISLVGAWTIVHGH